MARANIHVVPHRDGWAVKKERAERASSVHETQSAAEDQARGQAKADRVELVIHRRDGVIRGKDSYGNDPCPPRDKD